MANGPWRVPRRLQRWIRVTPASACNALSIEPHHGPFVHRRRAEAAVEADRGRVPVEHRPFEPGAASFHRESRPDAPAAPCPARPRARRGARTGLRDIAPACRGKSRNCGRTARNPAPCHLPRRSRPQRTDAARTGARPAPPRRIHTASVELFVNGKLADQLRDQRQVGGRGGADGDGHVSGSSGCRYRAPARPLPCAGPK